MKLCRTEIVFLSTLCYFSVVVVSCDVWFLTGCESSPGKALLPTKLHAANMLRNCYEYLVNKLVLEHDANIRANQALRRRTIHDIFARKVNFPISVTDGLLHLFLKIRIAYKTFLI